MIVVGVHPRRTAHRRTDLAADLVMELCDRTRGPVHRWVAVWIVAEILDTTLNGAEQIVDNLRADGRLAWRYDSTNRGKREVIVWPALAGLAVAA